MLFFRFKLMYFACLFLLLFGVSTAIADTNGFTISGYLAYNHSGMIYVKLMDQAQFERDMKGADPLTPFILKIQADSGTNDKKTIPFHFENVPKGIYAISCFQDINGNGKSDIGLFGPTEPWGMYRIRPNFFPVFKEEAFGLNGDMTNIIIDVK